MVFNVCFESLINAFAFGPKKNDMKTWRSAINPNYKNGQNLRNGKSI